PIIASIEKISSSTTIAFDTTSDLKRPVSTLSPPLFALDISQQVKSKRPSLSNPETLPAASSALTLDPSPDMFDFGFTQPPSASPEGDLNIASFVMEVRNRLSRLEAAHAEISRLRAALAESESDRTALQAQLSRLSASPPALPLATPPSASKAASFASVAATATTTASSPVSVSAAVSGCLGYTK
ncbi:hypothetical protein, partial, partial [Parasitella parasitica]